MKKILLDKKINIKEIIQKIELEPDESLTLIFPKNTNITKNDFLTLKNSAELLGKKIFIESIDEKILNLAKEIELESAHPLFDQNKLLTDIKKPNLESKSKSEHSILKIEKHKDFVVSSSAPEIDVPEIEAEEKPQKQLLFLKPKFLIILSTILILIGLLWWASPIFSSAQILITFKKIPFEFNENITLSKNTSDLNISQKIIPAELFKDEQNLTQLFKASGKSYIEEKAKGIITIYNAYSSAPQTLVAATRFEAPNGLIYRLTKNIVIPGAEIKDGKIIPSSITVEVIADKPGAEYNTGPIKKLTIPGFSGSPKYESFYGELKEGAKGGFIGEKLVPNKNDISSAEQKLKEVLKSNILNSFLIKKPQGFQLIGEPKITILNIKTNTTTDENGNFAVFGETKLEVLGVKETNILNFFLDFFSQKNKKIVDLNIEYLNPVVDLTRGSATLNLKARGNFVEDLNIQNLKKEISGRSIKDVQKIIKDINDLKSAKIIIKPFWVKTLPKNLDKINIVVN